jgi:polyisoprenoid-binding protein YceI
MKKLISTVLIILAVFQMGLPLDRKENVHVETGSHIKFTIKNIGITVDGRFESFTSDVFYDENNPEMSKFNGTIKVESVNTGIAKRDNHLRSDDYFDVRKYPEIRFSSTSVKNNGNDRLLVEGNLTIKNVTKKIKMNVAVSKSRSRKIFTTALQLDRRDYGVGGKSLFLSDDVVVDLRIIN